MAKADRDDALDTLALRLFDAMLDDIVVDVALQSHQEVARSRRKCDVCHTHCRQVHTPAPASTAGTATASQSTLPGSRPGTPPRDAGTPTVAGTPNGSVNKDGTMILDCVGCGRPMASNRYASHLSGCIGTGTGTRRAAVRNATSKSKLGSDAGRSVSPYPGSENGNMSDHNAPPPPPGPKKKGRPPKNKPRAPVQAASNAAGVINDEDALSNRKRPGSPLSSPTKNKKQKVSATALARAGTNTPGSKSQSKIPSRLRESSTASFLPEGTAASPGSRSSTPGTAATPTSSVPGNGRPNGTSGVVEEKRVPPRIPSPPRPVTRRPETDYLVDVEGDETGSSTDTGTD
ncbi:hypothetical protein DFH94DRAFT_435676 [Russula ochroleuca]|uniref:SAGA-associated factor 11 n=1 Tax=Russula ochroleuca TaxID=152965 RepID=A0A9P5T9I8_9AGAM|nr:hypothetical protein DFH94DRAFT_435676 [Russula ochroleuca]